MRDDASGGIVLQLFPPTASKVTMTHDILAVSLIDFARSIGISRRTLYSLLARGEGPPTIRIGRRRLIRKEAAEAWLLTQEAA